MSHIVMIIKGRRTGYRKLGFVTSDLQYLNFHELENQVLIGRLVGIHIVRRAGIKLLPIAGDFIKSNEK